ncbi:MAG: CO/xanthine dehydrogenase FAD-binding subunit [Paracoccaceae bacterium]|jgi:CO/xanthine dehydrogenase FAD-binding subunit
MTYHRPASLEQALVLCAVPGIRILAGGTDILPASPGRDLTGDILDITNVSVLSGINKTPKGWRIGATVRWADLMKTDLPPAFDALKAAAAEVGSPQIQTTASIAGNLCNASPAADGVPPLLILDAVVEITSAYQTRMVPLNEFLKDVRKTVLEQGEIVTAIHVPNSAAKGTSAFLKLGARKYLVISIAMVAVRLEIDKGKISNAAVAVGACSPTAKRLLKFEAALLQKSPHSPDDWQAELKADIAETLDPIDDMRADASYRTLAVVELVTQAIEQAAS